VASAARRESQTFYCLLVEWKRALKTFGRISLFRIFHPPAPTLEGPTHWFLFALFRKARRKRKSCCWVSEILFNLARIRPYARLNDSNYFPVSRGTACSLLLLPSISNLNCWEKKETHWRRRNCFAQLDISSPSGESFNPRLSHSPAQRVYTFNQIIHCDPPSRRSAAVIILQAKFASKIVRGRS